MSVEFRARLRRLKSSGTVAIASGTAVGQVIAVLAAPVLSRLYSPEDFGAFLIITSIGMAVGTVASLRYEMAIPLPRQHRDARDLVAISALAALGTCTALGAVSWILREPILDAFGGGLTSAGLVMALGIALLVAIYRLLNQWALRHHRYAVTAQRNVLQSLVTVLVQLGSGVAGYGGGLSVGLASGQAAGFVSLLRGSGLMSVHPSFRVRHNVRRYRKFPLLMTPAGLLNVAGLYMPLLLIASLYGVKVAGFVGLTQRVLGLPMTVIGQSVAQVFLSQLAQRRRDSLTDGYAMFWRATRWLSVVAALVAVTLLAAGPLLFEVAFGEQWRQAGVMSQALGLASAGQLVASALSHTLIVYERGWTQLLWDALRLLATAGAVVLAHKLGLSAVHGIWLFATATLATYIVLWELCRRTLRKQTRARP
jgi:O-antigen/teichoic acid export membrane protein